MEAAFARFEPPPNAKPPIFEGSPHLWHILISGIEEV